MFNLRCPSSEQRSACDGRIAEPTCKPNSVLAPRPGGRKQAVTIHLGGALLRRSCGLPGNEPSKSQISNEIRDSKGLKRTAFNIAPLFGLAPQGACLAEPVARLAGEAFTSPFHHRPRRCGRASRESVPLATARGTDSRDARPNAFGLSVLCCAIPSGHPAWPLASLLSYGVRTFLPHSHDFKPLFEI